MKTLFYTRREHIQQRLSQIHYKRQSALTDGLEYIQLGFEQERLTEEIDSANQNLDELIIPTCTKADALNQPLVVEYVCNESLSPSHNAIKMNLIFKDLIKYCWTTLQQDCLKLDHCGGKIWYYPRELSFDI